MITKKFKTALTEETFNESLPANLKKASSLYFTPLGVAEQAVLWLTEGGESRVLDIGAGVGKFCIAGARISNSFFCGVEYRPSLVAVARTLIDEFEVRNALVYQANILDVTFGGFNSFYLYNPFCENFYPDKKLTNEVLLSLELHSLYMAHTSSQLDKAPVGTRIATYHGNNFELPGSFTQVSQAFHGKLKYWVKV